MKLNHRKVIPLFFLFPLLIYFWPAQLYGNTNYIMLVGESMTPTIESGTLIITQLEYFLGDIVAFVNEDSTNVVHRIVEESKEGFVTKGDNNRRNDPGIITNEDILGRATFVLPYFGFVSMFIRTPLGMVIFGIFAVVMLAPKRSHKKKTVNKQSFAVYYAAFTANAINYVITQMALGDNILFAKTISIPFTNFFEPFLASTISFAMLSMSILTLYFIARNTDSDSKEKNPIKWIFAIGALMILITQMLSILVILPILVRLIEELFLSIDKNLILFLT